jgi:hypothetical protein
MLITIQPSVRYATRPVMRWEALRARRSPGTTCTSCNRRLVSSPITLDMVTSSKPWRAPALPFAITLGPGGRAAQGQPYAMSSIESSYRFGCRTAFLRVTGGNMRYWIRPRMCASDAAAIEHPKIADFNTRGETFSTPQSVARTSSGGSGCVPFS